MRPMVRRYAEYIIEQVKGPVLDPECQTPFLSSEAIAAANDHIEVLEKRGMLFDLIWSSNNIDVVYTVDPGLEETSDDPKDMVRRVALLCLQQAVVDMVVASSVA